MTDHPMQTPPRERTSEEVADQADAAFALHKGIAEDIRTANIVSWALAEKLYEWDEMRGWTHLGSDYRTISDWLADPEVGMARSLYYRLVGLWRDLVVTRKISTKRLMELEPSKVDTVMAAVKDHRAKLDDALADAKSMGHSDLRETYRKPRVPDPGTPGTPTADPDDDPGMLARVNAAARGDLGDDFPDPSPPPNDGTDTPIRASDVVIEGTATELGHETNGGSSGQVPAGMVLVPRRWLQEVMDTSEIRGAMKSHLREEGWEHLNV